jgi:TRAP-type mannitol/chloroaromatic compound transport system permease small subunit
MAGLLDRVARGAMPLALAVTVLLAAQWPLRDVVGVWSTQANDLAQWLFALYVAVAVTHAQRRRAHLVARPDLAEAHGAPRWRRLGAPLCLLSWSLFLLWSAAPLVWNSLLSFERFPETNNAGYFLVKVALWLLGLLIAAQSAAELRMRGQS